LGFLTGVVERGVEENVKIMEVDDVRPQGVQRSSFCSPKPSALTDGSGGGAVPLGLP
jgi:hypothetical protein